MRKIYIVFILVSLMILAACSGDGVEIVNESSNTQINYTTSSQNQMNTEIPIISDNLPITRVLAERMMVLSFNDDRELDFGGTELLTLENAQNLINSFGGSLRIELDDSNRDRVISYALWYELFMRTLEEIAPSENFLRYFGIEEQSFIVLATSGNNSLLPEWSVITDIGPFSSDGLNLDEYIDTEISVLVKNGEILAVAGVISTEPTIMSAYIVNYREGHITVFSGGAERSFAYRLNEVPIIGAMADITIANGRATNINITDEWLEGKVLLISSEKLELRGHGVFNVSPNFKVYSTEHGPVRWRNLRNILVGLETARFFVNENREIVGAIITEMATPSNLRVVLGTTGFTSLFHENVSISATDNFTVSKNSGNQEFSRGETIDFADLAIGERAFIETSENGRISINNILRNNRIPEYRGAIEISRTEQGFIIVNEVDLEEYLYSVVPSEMPVSFGLEALKAQAVTARSYAYNQFFSNSFHAFGANIDDSVMSQVYNNVLEHELSTRAVRETRGEVLTFNGNVISTNYFSTSAGVTANNGEVWANRTTGVFPHESQPYLRSKRLYWGTDYGDLSIEENARNFLKNWEIEAYDSDVSWFRWRLEMTSQQISNIVNHNLRTRYEANPMLIETMQADGSFKSQEISSVGSLVDIEVLRRGQAGNIMSLKIVGTENTIIAHTEYNIRMLLAPRRVGEGDDVIITRQDESQLANFSMMPSAYFTMERATDGEGNILFVRFFGGGFGHGVGMSQNAARNMAAQGMTYAEILRFFYDQTEIIRIN